MEKELRAMGNTEQEQAEAMKRYIGKYSFLYKPRISI